MFTSVAFQSINRRFQRLESHVVTLARSVAHLSSEMRTQHLMVQVSSICLNSHDDDGRQEALVSLNRVSYIKLLQLLACVQAIPAV